MQRPHLFFKNPAEGNVTLKVKSRFRPDSQSEDDNYNTPDIKSYSPMQSVFSRCKNDLIRDRTARRENKNISLNVPANIEYISIQFFDTFNSKGFETKYRNDFGLSPVHFSEFNSKVLFAIVDKDKFDFFLGNLELFINSDDPSSDTSFNPNIKFIKEFEFLTSERTIQFDEMRQYLRLNLMYDVPDISDEFNEIKNRLIEYLSENNINFKFDEGNQLLELIDISQEVLFVILDNFDVIHSVNSPRSGIISPSQYNLPQRSYDFSISNVDADLPIIGLIDTGISGTSPLNSVIVNEDDSYDLTGTNAKIDNVDHGTAAAALAVLGNKYIIDQNSNSFEADAKLLSIKVADNSSDIQIKESDVIHLIRKAHSDYGVRIFVLNISYQAPKKINSSVSHYAYMLDSLAYKLDLIILISVGNIDSHLLSIDSISPVPVDYPEHFKDSRTTLNEPADSYNNISVGACADNLELFDYGQNHAEQPEFPASYSRRFYHDYSHQFFISRNGGPNYTRINKMLCKPDVIYPGGNYNMNLDPFPFGLLILTNNVHNAYTKHIGTSYSAPLLANLAARIISQYPNISMQSVKTLIINSAHSPKSENVLDNSFNFKLHFLNGKGIPSSDKALFSDNNSVTMLLEDDIEPKKIKSYTINLPRFLNDSTKRRSILKVSATLCFKFLPVQSNQLAYCPIDISFGIFKNLPLESTYDDDEPTGLNGNSSEAIKFKDSVKWSQDYYYKNKMLSNCQKIAFSISKRDLISENNTFKLVVKCQLHKLLPDYISRDYLHPHDFSIVISIFDNSGVGMNIYDELVAINELTAITEIEAQIDLDN